jgi:hypothetical protein
MSLKTLKAKLVGVAPIMFHNERLANPTDPLTRELKKLTAQRSKSDDLYEQIKHLEWRAGFYEEEGRVVVPADNVLATVLQGARKQKKGKDVSAGVIADAAAFQLEYDGPKDWNGLYADQRFVDYRTVVIGGRRTMRARPIFKEWQLSITLLFDPEIMNDRDLRQAIEIAGERVGICERRPRYGRFLVE